MSVSLLIFDPGACVAFFKSLCPGTSAYTGATQYLSSQAYVTTSGSILATEASQASWISASVNRDQPWGSSFEVSHRPENPYFKKLIHTIHRSLFPWMKVSHWDLHLSLHAHLPTLVCPSKPTPLSTSQEPFQDTTPPYNTILQLTRPISHFTMSSNRFLLLLIKDK